MIKTDDRDELVILENMKNYCKNKNDIGCDECKLEIICDVWREGKVPLNWEIQYDSNNN